MHIISRKLLREYCQKHTDSCKSLDDWYKTAQQATWTNLIEVQKVYPPAESVGSFTVFNIKGNNYRLIVSINYSDISHTDLTVQMWAS
ncbi:type II toxin-antitoxin system HigB family toxin [Geminocystis sp. CENA526]|uniref:type II toxin-antitoxin system HigB family toxin n=1 Tax=Geminocystis sp. CENA526 TaxID=1355871 RepID=UPI003D6F0F7E